MVEKRGQVGLFILIGVVVLLIGFLVFGLRSNSVSLGKESQKITEVNENAPIAKRYLEQCMMITLEQALLEQGYVGSLYFNGRYTDGMAPPDGIAILYENGTIVQPTMQELLDELGMMMKENMNYCLLDLGMSYEGDILKTEVTYYDGRIKVLALTDYRVSMKDATLTFENLQTETEFDYLKIYSFVRMILQKEQEDPEWIPMTDLMDSDYETEIRQMDGGIVYSLTSKTDMIGDERYTYQFANYFGEEE